jgi:hypothetical protein
MRIREIITVHASPFDLRRIHRRGEVLVNYNSSGIDGYKFYKNQQDGFIIFYLVDGNDIIAGIISQLYKNYIQIKRIHVKEKYRGNKLGVKMYHGIIYSEYKNLISDIEQTSNGKKVWKDISDIIPVKSLNLITGEYGEIADAYHENEHIVLVTVIPNLIENILIPNLKII